MTYQDFSASLLSTLTRKADRKTPLRDSSVKFPMLTYSRPNLFFILPNLNRDQRVILTLYFASVLVLNSMIRYSLLIGRLPNIVKATLQTLDNKGLLTRVTQKKILSKPNEQEKNANMFSHKKCLCTAGTANTSNLKKSCNNKYVQKAISRCKLRAMLQQF